MKLDPLIKANALAHKGKYDEAVKLLEPEESRYYTSFIYYYLMGICNLYLRVPGKALNYLRLAREFKLKEQSVLLGIASVFLNRGDTDKAVDMYLEILDMDEHNKTALKALKIIKKYPGPENITLWLSKNRIHTLFPPLPKKPAPVKEITGVIAVVFVILGLCAGIAAYNNVFPFYQRNIRRIPQELELLREDLEAPMQTEGSFRYVLTRNEIDNLYNEARRFFTSFNDERARVNINRILESNGPEPVKNKARLLLSFLETPGFDTLRDRFTFLEVNSEPILYRGCHIIWRGIATNIEVQNNHTSFDLLVGYDTRRTMEGIVRVDFDFAASVNPDRPVEILGRVAPYSSDRGLVFRVHGIALNQAGLLDQAN